MSVERINSQLKKVREQIAQLQAKEKDLAEQKQMAEDAEAMKIIRKYKISSERLQMLNKLSEDEVRNLLQKREQERRIRLMKTGDYRLGQWCPLCYRQYFFVCRLGHFLPTGQILWRFMRRIPQSRKQRVRQKKAVQKAQRPALITRTVPVVEKSYRAVHGEYNRKFHRRHN